MFTTESELLAAIEQDRDDDSRRLVYADWLEDRGDDRCEFVRAVCAVAADSHSPEFSAAFRALDALRVDESWLLAVSHRIDVMLTGPLQMTERGINILQEVRNFTGMEWVDVNRLAVGSHERRRVLQATSLRGAERAWRRLLECGAQVEWTPVFKGLGEVLPLPGDSRQFREAIDRDRHSDTLRSAYAGWLRGRRDVRAALLTRIIAGGELRPSLVTLYRDWLTWISYGIDVVLVAVPDRTIDVLIQVRRHSDFSYREGERMIDAVREGEARLVTRVARCSIAARIAEDFGRVGARVEFRPVLTPEAL